MIIYSFGMVEKQENVLDLKNETDTATTTE